MPLRPLHAPGADLGFDPHWLPAGEADSLFPTLLDCVPWENHPVRLFGREIPAPRLSCWIGDPGLRYRYSGIVREPRPWLPVLDGLRARLRAELAIDFNSVLANLYRDGGDAMGWHADDERELGPAPVIASVSLGATRRFVLRRRDPAHRMTLDLAHGSLLVMAGSTQSAYEHALPRTRRPVGARINLTFRRLRPDPEAAVR